ncbi:MAG: ABC transporter permease [Anaerolineae bacterium]|jgi:peptide/nickel transport system permease protein|nr:ABC transporter permease [Anaerolineae bacterium]
MIRYLVRRVLLLILTLLLTSMIVFAMTQALPGDIARLVLGRDARPEAVAAFRQQFGLNDPLPVQYLRWLGGFVTGNPGRSFAAGNPPVMPLVLDRLGNSFLLAGYTLLLTLPLSIVAGIVAALREGSWLDNLIAFISLSVTGLPEFVTGIVLINLFALGTGWFAATSLVQDGYTVVDWLRVLTLPALTAGFVLGGYVTRMTRAGMIDELKKAYVRTAILKGLPRRTIILRHVLRNALLPTITVIAISFGWLMGGLVVIENVFNYPGLGSLLVTAVEQKNLPVLQTCVVLIVFIFAAANLLADVLYAALNPRIRLT